MPLTPNLDAAIGSLELTMQTEVPGPYPDPNVPIEIWQQAHEHLLAAKELLMIAHRGMGH